MVVFALSSLVAPYVSFSKCVSVFVACGTGVNEKCDSLRQRFMFHYHDKTAGWWISDRRWGSGGSGGGSAR